MRIVDERKKDSINFEELEIGKVFFFENTDEYGKNPYISIEDIISDDEIVFDAVDLTDGIPVSIKGNEKVIPCEAILTIK